MTAIRLRMKKARTTMSKLHDTLNQQVRQTCRACHNVCFVSADADGVAPPVPAEGYRCEGCEAAGYERPDFDKSLAPMDATEPGEATEATGDTEPIEATEPTEATDATSEARPSDEPKSADDPQGEVVEVTAAAPEAE